MRPRAGVTALLLAASVAAAQAQPVPARDLDASARAAFLDELKAANQRYDAGDFGEALARYEALLLRVSLPELHLRRGACLERLDRPLEAARAYRTYVEQAPDARDAGRVRADADRLEARAAERSAVRVAVTSRPAGAEVRLDGPSGPRLGATPLDTTLAPGSHRLHLAAPGHHPESRDVVARAGQLLSLEVSLLPLAVPPQVVMAPAEPPPDRRPLAWAFAGVGGALAVTSGVLWYLTESKIQETNDYDRRKPGHTRAELEDLQAEVPRYELGFWITGGLALAAGATSGLLFWQF